MGVIPYPVPKALNLRGAIALAMKEHAGQVDKAGMPYILHPLRVMANPRLKTEIEYITGILHDIVEDTRVTLRELYHVHGCGDSILYALYLLSKLPEEEDDYDAFIDRICDAPLGIGKLIAMNVKLADLEDNADMSRIANPTKWDHKRCEKYQRAIKKIEVVYAADCEAA